MTPEAELLVMMVDVPDLPDIRNGLVK